MRSRKTAKDRKGFAEGLSESGEPPARASLLWVHHSLMSISFLLTSNFNFNLELLNNK